jgi:hypothetical protein
VAPGHVVVVDQHWSSPTIDAEVGSLILLPPASVVEPSTIEFIADLPAGQLYRAVAPGITRVSAGDWAAFVRISRHEYVGRAEYRHMEDDDE